MLHIKNNKELIKSFNFSHHTQKYKLSDMLDEIIYVMKYNIPYRAIRSKIKWMTIYKVYRKLVRYKVFKLSYKELLCKYLKRGNLGKKLRYVSTDTTFVMNKKGNVNVGLNKYYYKKKGNKLSLIIDSNKKILDIRVYKGGKNDGKILENQLENFKLLDNDEYGKYKRYFLCDAGYDSKKIHKKLRERSYIPLIEQNRRGIKNEKLIRRFSKEEYKIYCKRAKVENAICMLKQMRRINTRYDGLIETYAGYVYMGALYISC
jgi:transposase